MGMDRLKEKAIEPKWLQVIDLGRCAYGQAWQLQKERHAQRLNNACPDTLLLVEHPHVYTLGKHAKAQHLIADENYLKRRGIEVYRTDRGGDITYHGPGQIVGYPIFDLRNHRPSVGWFIQTLEEVLIDTLAVFGIHAGRIVGMTGVWVGHQKIAAIGMRVSQWVTMHGLALNVAPDLSYFQGIVPCGISDKGVTRMVDLNPQVQLDAVKAELIRQFVVHFGFSNFVHKSISP